MKPAWVHPTAIVEEGVRLGPGTMVWDGAHIRRGASLGQECIVGEKSYIAYDVRVGERVKINAHVYLCAAVTIEDGAMISAGVLFTNDRFPRATTPDLARLYPSQPDENTEETLVKVGATLGVGAMVGPGLTVGRFAMVGMGAVLTRDLPDFSLVYGNPARVVGWVCRCGPRLKGAGPKFECERCGRAYALEGAVLREEG